MFLKHLKVSAILKICASKRLFSKVFGPNVADNVSQMNRRVESFAHEQQVKLKRPLQQPANPKVVKVAVIGAPNAGKSTLVNKLLGYRVAGVSSKVHTTRDKIVGVFTQNDTQLLVLDTPGLIVPAKCRKHNLERTLLTSPHSTVAEADIVVAVVDVSKIWSRSRIDPEVLKVLHLHQNKQSLLVLNKVDIFSRYSELLHVARKLTGGIINGSNDWFKKQPKKVTLTDIMDRVNKENTSMTSTQDVKNVDIAGDIKLGKDVFKNTQDWNLYYRKLNVICRDIKDKISFEGFARVFYTSALNDTGVSDLREYLMSHALPGEWVYDASVVTDQSPMQMAISCVRDKIMDHLPKEIPYQINIEPALFAEDEDHMLRVVFNVVCCYNRQVFYVLGGDGHIIRQVASEAKQELMNVFRRDLSLKLVVKYRKMAHK